MTISAVCQLRHFLRALVCRVLASRAERAAAWHMKRTGDVALQDDTLAGLSNLVYGCTGCAFSSSASAISTIFPRYITAIRLEM